VTGITPEWAAAQMPRVARAVSGLPDMQGVRLAMSMHLDMKMVPLVAGLRAKGAELYITTCNPATVRDAVVAEMRGLGAEVVAWKDMGQADWDTAIAGGIDWGPTYLSEMGADYTHHLLTTGRAMPSVRAGLEATGSGINRLRGALPPWPIFNWDDLPVKEGLHNRHMVGLTTWAALFQRTLLSLHEKTVLVVGYGSVGQGLAASARAFGGTVMVAEIDPGRALQARYDGWRVATVEALAPEADVIVTATGARHVLPFPVMEGLRDGCLLLNAGHLIDEIELGPLMALPSGSPTPGVTTHSLPSGNRVHLFVGGAMANLTGGEGDSLNAFDVTLAVMAAGIGYVVGDGAAAEAGVHVLPQEVWEGVL
jgi:adenosylhomocysteinase